MTENEKQAAGAVLDSALTSRTDLERRDGDQGTLPGGLMRALIIVFTVTFGMMINLANATAMSISLPTLQKELGLEPADLQWVISAYSLSSGCLLLVSGRLADLYGRKRSFLLGMVIQGVFTLACGFANDVLTLDILRAIQGIGSAATIPASLGILAHAFPPSRARSLAFATFSAGAPVGAVFGSTLGGVLTEYTRYTWRSPFFMLAGFNLLCFTGAFFTVDKDLPSQEADQRVDWLGAFLITVGLILVVFVLSQGEIAPQGWKTPYIIALLIIGVILIGLFILWQHYLDNVSRGSEAKRSVWTPPPLMSLSIWARANGRLGAMMVIAFTTWCAFLAWNFWVQLYYQNYHHLSAMSTVARLLPMFVSGLLCNIFVGLMAAHVPLVVLVSVGAGATTLACLLLAIIKPGVTYWAYGFPSTAVVVMGADFVFCAGTLFIAKFALPHEQSLAGALFITMTQLGTAVGITVSTIAYNSTFRKLLPGEDGIKPYRIAQWTGVGFGVVATILGVVAFRGVGVVGERKKASDSDTAHPQVQLGEENGLSAKAVYSSSRPGMTTPESQVKTVTATAVGMEKHSL